MDNYEDILDEPPKRSERLTWRDVKRLGLGFIIILVPSFLLLDELPFDERYVLISICVILVLFYTIRFLKIKTLRAVDQGFLFCLIYYAMLFVAFSTFNIFMSFSVPDMNLSNALTWFFKWSLLGFLAPCLAITALILYNRR